jgi:hypothetical protein
MQMAPRLERRLRRAAFDMVVALGIVLAWASFYAAGIMLDLIPS